MKDKKILKLWKAEEKHLADMDGRIRLFPSHAYIKGWFSSSDLYQIAQAQEVIGKLFKKIET